MCIMQKRIVLELMLSFLANAHDYLYKSNLSSSQVHGKHYYVSIA